MKLNRIVAACAALTAASAFAVCPTANTAIADTATLVNQCAPEVTFFVGGASAQAGAMTAVLAAGTGIFDTAAPRAKLYLTSTTISGLNSTTVTDRTKSNTIAYIGIGAASTPVAGKRVLVVYNKANGSAAGVFQLLAGKGSLAGEDVTIKTVSAADQKAGTAGTCTINGSEPTVGTLADWSCTSEVSLTTAWGVDKQKAMHMAMSDVYPNELVPGTLGKVKWAPAKHPATKIGMQGFGVIVNPALYSALITKNIAENKLDAACASETIGNTTDAITFACQPSISKADYASIISDATFTAAKLLGNSTTEKLVLARRVDSSGTQASSNIFFGGQAAYSSFKTAGTDGYLTLLGGSTTADGKVYTLPTLAANLLSPAPNAAFDVFLGAGTGDVITQVSTTTDYRIGVVSLENTYSFTKSASKLKGAAFVKIDGVSPNMSITGLDAKHRAGMQKGYGFAFEGVSLVSAKMATDVKLAPQKHIADTIATALSASSYDLAGIAYIGSTDTAKNTAYTHGGNNYLPLQKTN